MTAARDWGPRILHRHFSLHCKRVSAQLRAGLTQSMRRSVTATATAVFVYGSPSSAARELRRRRRIVTSSSSRRYQPPAALQRYLQSQHMGTLKTSILLIVALAQQISRNYPRRDTCHITKANSHYNIRFIEEAANDVQQDNPSSARTPRLALRLSHVSVPTRYRRRILPWDFKKGLRGRAPIPSVRA